MACVGTGDGEREEEQLPTQWGEAEVSYRYGYSMLVCAGFFASLEWP